MKNLFRISAFLFLFAMSIFACSEATDHIDVSANKHSNYRTNTTYYISGTATLPAGSYDIVEVAPGSNVTFSSGTTINTITSPNSSTPIYMTIPVGVSITTNAPWEIPSNMTFTNRGILTSAGSMLTCAGTFDNYSQVNAVSFSIAGTFHNRIGALLKASATIGQLNTLSGTINLYSCSRVEANEVFCRVTNLFSGRGMVKTNSTVVQGPFCYLTISSTIDLCSGVNYLTSGGSLGNAVLTCTSSCA